MPPVDEPSQNRQPTSPSRPATSQWMGRATAPMTNRRPHAASSGTIRRPPRTAVPARRRRAGTMTSMSGNDDDPRTSPRRPTILDEPGWRARRAHSPAAGPRPDKRRHSDAWRSRYGRRPDQQTASDLSEGRRSRTWRGLERLRRLGRHAEGVFLGAQSPPHRLPRVGVLLKRAAAANSPSRGTKKKGGSPATLLCVLEPQALRLEVEVEFVW